MILVDTSVFIDLLKGRDTESLGLLERVINSGIPYGISEPIYLEILQGAKGVGEFRKLKEYFETLPFYGLRRGKESFEASAYINVMCRSAGITVRSTVDLLIAQTAIENELYLLHNDADFFTISRVVPELKTYGDKAP